MAKRKTKLNLWWMQDSMTEQFAAFRRKIYTSTRWRKLRLIKLGQDPWCAQCEIDGRLTPATQVDHRIPLKEIYMTNDYEMAFDLDYLTSICEKCHGKKSYTEGIGKYRQLNGN